MNRTITLSLLLSLCFILLSQNSFAQTAKRVYFAATPAISPNGQTVVFCYDSDLWKVPAKRGRAVRLTGMDGQEKNPSSPKWKVAGF